MTCLSCAPVGCITSHGDHKGYIIAVPGPPGPGLSDAQLAELQALIAGGGMGGQGPQGPVGPAGKDGTKWILGEGAPATVIGSSPGDVYLDTLTGQIYKLGA